MTVNTSNQSFFIPSFQSYINYNINGGGTRTITTPSYGVFFYIFGDNYGDTNITMTTWVNAGGSGLRLYNTYVPPGFSYALASTGAQTFTVRASFPPGYNSFSVKYIRMG